MKELTQPSQSSNRSITRHHIFISTDILRNESLERHDKEAPQLDFCLKPKGDLYTEPCRDL
jgi:hypothetical protein